MAPYKGFTRNNLAGFEHEKNGIFTSKKLPRLSQKKHEKNEPLSLASLGFRVFKRPVFNSVIYNIDSVLLHNHHSNRPLIGAWSFWVLLREE